MRNDRQVQLLVHEMEKGSTRAFKMIEECSLQENSGALQQFLLYLKKPLFPTHIQALALGSLDQFFFLITKIVLFQTKILVLHRKWWRTTC